jgi:hypothetical protein
MFTLRRTTHREWRSDMTYYRLDEKSAHDRGRAGSARGALVVLAVIAAFLGLAVLLEPSPPSSELVHGAYSAPTHIEDWRGNSAGLQRLD